VTGASGISPGPGVVDLLVLGLRLELGEERIDVTGVEPHPIEGFLSLELLEDLGQGPLVPLRQLAGAVERDAQGRGLDLGDVEQHHVALGPPQALHGQQAPVAADDPARGPVDDQRLRLAEALEGGDDRLHVLLSVGAGVRRVEVERVDRDSPDGEPVGVVLGR
jgi:hypothetical protein